MKLTDLVRPLIQQKAIIGLTGGGVTKLDGLVTVGVALSPVPIIMFSLGGAVVAYILRAGVDAEASPQIIRPDDYAGGTNEKVWERFNFALSSPALFGDGSVGAPALAFTSEATSGIYRAGAGDVRVAILGNLAAQVRYSVAAGGAHLGIGTSADSSNALSGSVHVLSTSAADQNMICLENPAAAAALSINFVRTTTGAGAARTDTGYYRNSLTVFNHATRTSTTEIAWYQAGTIRRLRLNSNTMSLLDGALTISCATGDLNLATAGGNGNVILTPNGTGRVQLALDGAVGTPALNFVSDPTTGFYRGAASDLRVALGGVDAVRFVLQNVGSATNVGTFLVGPGTATAQMQLSLTSSSSFNQFLLNNPDSTNAVESIIGFTTTTTNAGGAVNTRVAYISMAASVHDHATRTGLISFLWLDSGSARFITLTTARMAPGVTNTIDIGSSSLAFKTGYFDTSIQAPSIVTNGSSLALTPSGANVVTIGGGGLVILAAKTLRIQSGANQRAGDAVLVAGTVTTANTTVTANTRVYLSRKTAGGAVGDLTYTLNAGVGFTINSANGADTSTVSYMLVEVS